MKKDYTIGVEAKKIYKQKLIMKITKLAFLFLLVVFTVTYFLLYILYSKSNFIISLDKNASNRKNIFLSEDGSYENIKIELQAESLDYMDNISINWINPEVDKEKDGSHNGDNYIAYSFYVVNLGQEKVRYWYQMNIEEAIKEVDEAVRIMVYRNGERKVYAKENKISKEAEVGTSKFYSESMPVMEKVEDFESGEKDRFTVVVWLEGDDPDCIDKIIGGEMKLRMDIIEEHIEE